MDQEEYLARATPRLARLDKLAPRCAFDKWPHERTAAEHRAWDEYQRLMAEQLADEVAAGL